MSGSTSIRTVFVGVLLLLAGCSNSAPSTSDFDSEEALTVLVTALESWKSGKASDLSSGNPPIRFVDDDWSEQAQLVKYELEADEVLIQPFADIPVRLTLRDRQGRSVERSATYQVTLEPGRSVLRSDS